MVMGNCFPGRSQNYATTTSSFRRVPKTSDSPLTTREIKLLRKVWNRRVAEDPVTFFTNCVTKAMMREENIRRVIVVGTAHSSDRRAPTPPLEITDRAVMICRKVADFNVKFSQALTTGEVEKAKEMATQLGQRHYYFGGDIRFQPIYWDIFVLSGTQAVEDLGGKPSEIFIIQMESEWAKEDGKKVMDNECSR